MEKLLYLLIIPFVRFLININHYLYLKKAIHKHDQFIAGEICGENEIKKKRIGQKAGNWIQENQLEIKKRTLNTGIQDQYQSYMEPLGLGSVQRQSMSALDNLLFLNTEILQSARQILKTAKGHYKVQAFLSFSPLFWVELMIFLPRELLKMVGFEIKSKGSQNITNVIQLLYWIASIIYMIKLITKQSS